MKTNLASALLDVSVRILSSVKFNLSLFIRFIAQSVILTRLYMKESPNGPNKSESVSQFWNGFWKSTRKKFFSRKNIDSLSSDDTFLLRETYFHPDLIVVSMLPPNPMWLFTTFLFFACLHRHDIGFGWKFALCHWVFFGIELKFHGNRTDEAESVKRCQDIWIVSRDSRFKLNLFCNWRSFCAKLTVGDTLRLS